MTEKHNNPDPYYYEDDEIDLLDLLIVLAKRKKLIIGITTLFALVSIAYVLMATPIYRTSTRILPPMAASQSRAMSMMSQVPGFAAGFATDALGIKAPGDLVVGIVNSRTIKDKLIDRFDLQNRYETEMRDTTREALANNTSATTDT